MPKKVIKEAPEEHKQITEAEIQNCDDIAVLKSRMTLEECLFVEHYLKELDITKAVRRIYSNFGEEDRITPEYAGMQLMKRPIVNRYLELRRKEICSLVVTKEDILLNVRKVVQKCMEPSVFKDKDGEIHEGGIDAKNALKGLEMLGNTLDMFEKTKMIQSTNLNKNEYIIPENVINTVIKQLNDDC